MARHLIIFRDEGDDIYIDTDGDLMFRPAGEEPITVCTADNVEELIDFLRAERARLAAREVAK